MQIPVLTDDICDKCDSAPCDSASSYLCDTPVRSNKKFFIQIKFSTVYIFFRAIDVDVVDGR